MADIFSKLVESDVIVLSTPVYFYSVSARMKAMIDRCLIGHKQLTNKQFYYIITAADPLREAAKGTPAALNRFVRCLPNAEVKETIYGMGTWDKGDVYRHPAFERAYKAGREI